MEKDNTETMESRTGESGGRLSNAKRMVLVNLSTWHKGKTNIWNHIETDAKRLKTWLTLVQVIAKETRKGWHESKPAPTCPEETSHGESCWLGWESWSLNQIHTPQGPRERCWHVTWLETRAVLSPLWCCRRLQLEHLPAPPVPEKMKKKKKKLHFGSEWWELNEKWRLQVGQAGPLGMNFHSRSFKLFWGAELIKRAFLWPTSCWRREKRMLIWETQVAAPKRPGNNEGSKRKHRQTHSLQPENSNVQTMATGIIPILASLSSVRKSRPKASYVPWMEIKHSSLMTFTIHFIEMAPC